MTQSQNTLQYLNEKVGGEWKRSTMPEGREVVTADFPKYQAQAVAAVLNSVAEDLGEQRSVYAPPKEGSVLPKNDPKYPSEVTMPATLADSPAFQKAIENGVKSTISEQMSLQISRGVSLGV